MHRSIENARRMARCLTLRYAPNAASFGANTVIALAPVNSASRSRPVLFSAVRRMLKLPSEESVADTDSGERTWSAESWNSIR